MTENISTLPLTLSSPGLDPGRIEGRLAYGARSQAAGSPDSGRK